MKLQNMQEHDIPTTTRLVTQRFLYDPKNAAELRGIDDALNYMEPMVKIQLRFYQRYGEVCVLENQKGVIAFHLKSQVSMRTLLFMVFPMLRLVFSFPKNVRKQLTENANRIGNVNHINWKKEVYKGEHYYIALLCVDETMKGTGAFRSLIESVLRKADANGMPVFLDTHNPANLPIYQHFGFEIVKEFPGNPESRLTQYCMMRKGPEKDR